MSFLEGVFGVLGLSDEAQPNVIQLMARALESKPPVRSVINGQIAMGVKRISLARGIQTTEPRWTEDRSLCASINGEIHNYSELSLHLERKGHVVHNDAELVAYLYQLEGDNFLRLLDGLFVIAIWDQTAQQLILAQDRYGGIRQMYYCLAPKGFVFASSIRSILATGMMERQVNRNALFSFFTTRHIFPPHTMFRGILKLMPGSILSCQNGLVRIFRADNFNFSPSPEGIECTLEDSFPKAVKKRLAHDRPVGLFLSGGIDSSVTVATASRLRQDPLQTFSMGFDHEELDESHYAQLVADHCGTNHQQLFLNSDDAVEPLPTITWYLEEPLADDSVIPTYWLAHHTKAMVDVALASDGPDHLFGRFYWLVKQRQFFRAIPGSSYLASHLQRRRKLSNNPILRAAQRVASIHSVPSEQTLVKWDEVEEERSLLSATLQTQCEQWDRGLEPLCPQAVNEYEQFVGCDFIGDGSFGVFTKLGKMAAGESLLIREPYLDRDVVDSINHLPQHLKVKGSQWQYLHGKAKTKFYLRRALAMHLLPQEILSKRKAGFAPPLNIWLRQKLHGVSPDKLLSPQVRHEGYFNCSYVEQLLSEHVAGTGDHMRLLFMLLVFDIWHRLYIESFTIDRPTADLSDYYK